MKRFLIAALLLFGSLIQALASPAFIVGEKDGKAAYLDTESGIWHKTDCAVCSLPNSADRAVLRCGIPADSNAELTRILEDFCS